MKNGDRSLTVLATLAVLTACGPADPQQAALDALVRQGYALSIPEFHRAAVAGDTRALKLFQASGIAIDVAGRDHEGATTTALREAIRHGNEAAAEWLLKQGASLADADTENANPLAELAVRSGNGSLLRHLLHRPDFPSRDPATLIPLAVAQGDPGVLDAVLDQWPQAPMEPALLLACQQGHLTAVHALLGAGANPNSADPATGQTPLMAAAEGDHEAVVALLLASGAYRFAVDLDGRLAADYVASDSQDTLAMLWQPPNLSERELGVPPPDHSAPLPDPWPQQEPPSTLSVALHPDTPRTMLPLHLATIGHHSGLVKPPPHRQRLAVLAIRPAQLPLHLISLSPTSAAVEDLNHPGPTLHVNEGDAIGGTGFRVIAIRRRPAAAFPEWLEGVLIVQMESNPPFALLPGLPARGGGLCALLHVTGTDEFYEAHPGDAFRFAGLQPTLTVLAVHPLRVELTDQEGPFSIALTPSPRVHERPGF